MGVSEHRFTKAIVETIAKRSANLCSNPDCGALTTGPAEKHDRSITVGEAAHIYGAHPGSARYDPEMSAADRSGITNAIWLCRNCHKIVDTDPSQFPAELLFEWRREHERQLARKLGKTGEILRQKIAARTLEGFDHTSYLAQQIVIDKPDLWEYRLTVELLRTKLAPILARWQSLKAGLYSKPVTRVSEEEAFDWFRDRIHEASMMPDTITGVLNEFTMSWGEPGVPGSETEILRVCELFAEACSNFLSWEEGVRFVRLSNNYEDLQTALIGTVGGFIDQIATVPAQLAMPLNDEKASGTYMVGVTIALPKGWSERANTALAEVQRKVLAGS
jgi:hypothetical protein